MKTEREYKVRFNEINKETGKKENVTESFANLRMARIFSREKFRMGSFTSLMNRKKVLLPI